MEVTYRMQEGFRLPNLLLPQEAEVHLGKYAELRRQYIKKHRRVLYTNLKTSGQLAAHLAEIETAAEKMVTRLVAQMAQNEGVTEKLKAADPQRWTGLMNNLKHSAEETGMNTSLKRSYWTMAGASIHGRRYSRISKPTGILRHAQRS